MSGVQQSIPNALAVLASHQEMKSRQVPDVPTQNDGAHVRHARLHTAAIW